MNEDAHKQKQWIEKRIEKILKTADMVKYNAPYVTGLAETIKRDTRKLRKYLAEMGKEEKYDESKKF